MIEIVPKIPDPPRVGLLVTCLVDFFRPSVGFAAVELLERSGCKVSVPRFQTCCGQPSYNSGDRTTAAGLARKAITVFERFDCVVVPSGSCAGMVIKHYPALLSDDPNWGPRAKALAEKTFELISFLYDRRQVRSVDASCDAVATYHDSCSGLRELDVKVQPRALLNSVRGLGLVEMTAPEVCCGFGGTFCVKYPDISDQMVKGKIDDIARTGAGLVLAGDLGCLLNIAGKLKRAGSNIAVRHIAEVLAGTDAPPIGHGDESWK